MLSAWAPHIFSTSAANNVARALSCSDSCSDLRRAKEQLKAHPSSVEYVFTPKIATSNLGLRRVPGLEARSPEPLLALDFATSSPYCVHGPREVTPIIAKEEASRKCQNKTAPSNSQHKVGRSKCLSLQPRYLLDNQ